jgi:hypothetical protein
VFILLTFLFVTLFVSPSPLLSLSCNYNVQIANAFRDGEDPTVSSEDLKEQVEEIKAGGVPEEMKDVFAGVEKKIDRMSNGEEMDEDEDDLDEDSDNRWDPNEAINFDVCISKGLPSRDGTPRRMMISCSMYKGEWQIDRLGCDDGRMTDMAIDQYDGPAFNMLADEMQQAMYDYLGERGIDQDLPEKLALMAQAKESQEYTHWLSRVEEFLLYDPLKAHKEKLDSRKVEALKRENGLRYDNFRTRDPMREVQMPSEGMMTGLPPPRMRK